MEMSGIEERTGAGFGFAINLKTDADNVSAHGDFAEALREILGDAIMADVHPASDTETLARFVARIPFSSNEHKIHVSVEGTDIWADSEDFLVISDTETLMGSVDFPGISFMKESENSLLVEIFRRAKKSKNLDISELGVFFFKTVES